ncbi:MAG: hypothetical protein R2911_24945 [Caldilineaceae bacterium]
MAAGAINTVVSLPANEDTYVASNRAGTNYGGADSLLLGYSAEGLMHWRCASSAL